MSETPKRRRVELGGGVVEIDGKRFREEEYMENETVTTGNEPHLANEPGYQPMRQEVRTVRKKRLVPMD